MFMEQGARGPGKPRQLPPSIFYPPPSHAPEACCPHSKHDFRRTKSSKATPTAPKRHTARPLHPPHGHVSASAHRQTSSGVGDRHATRRLRADAAGRACKAVPCRIILGLPELGKLPFPLPPPPPQKKCFGRPWMRLSFLRPCLSFIRGSFIVPPLGPPEKRLNRVGETPRQRRTRPRIAAGGPDN